MSNIELIKDPALILGLLVGLKDNPEYQTPEKYNEAIEVLKNKSGIEENTWSTLVNVANSVESSDIQEAINVITNVCE